MLEPSHIVIKPFKSLKTIIVSVKCNRIQSAYFYKESYIMVGINYPCI